MITITTNESNPLTLKVLIALKRAARSDYCLDVLDAPEKPLAVPLRLPAIRVNERVQFFSSNACLLYLSYSEVWGEKARRWFDYESYEVTPNVTLAVSFKSDAHKNALIKNLKCLNKLVEDEELLTASAVTLYEITLWCSLYPLWLDESVKNEYFEAFKSLDTWMTKVSQDKNVQSALEEYKIQPGMVSYRAVSFGAKYLLTINAQGGNTESHDTSGVTGEEMDASRLFWQQGRGRLEKPRVEVSPILPIAGEKNILITAALPYVNNVPHLGNIIGCVLSADVFARFSRLCNWNTLFIGGTDEYGTATETKAIEEGLTPREICDKYFEIHNAIYRWFNIGFDYFGRTTIPEQTAFVQEMFGVLKHNEFMETQPVEQLLCEKCDRYLADRFVEGGCPHPGCEYEDARGDQCDRCGKLVNATELKNPRCKVCQSTPVVKTSTQFFLALNKLEPLILRWLKDHIDDWTPNARVITKSWMREGLKARCITRDLKWGVPVPVNGFRDKVFYVWFDAPLGYVSITQRYTKEWKRWWKPAPTTEISLYQFMGKDNVPFHAVMFPGCLLGANQGYTLVKHIMATEYVNYEDGKFSKSRGIGVFGNDAQETGISSDVWRFYLLYIRPEGQDTNFSWNDLAMKNNSELLNNLGNFVNRALIFTEKFFASKVPPMTPNPHDFFVLAMCTRELKAYCRALEACKLRDGLRHILAISKHGNHYMQEMQPWLLVKGADDDVERAGTAIGICVNLVCLLAILIFPYMPDTSRAMRKQLNAPDELFVLNPKDPGIVQFLPCGHTIGKPTPLFTKLEPDFIAEMRKKFSGGVELNDDTDIAALEKAVQEQADKVRLLKSSGVEKSIWQPEVNNLLQLKKKLEAAQKAKTTVVSQNDDDAANQQQQQQQDAFMVKSHFNIRSKEAKQCVENDVESLNAQIAVQAEKVRTLKREGAEKAEWQPELNILLELKKKLAVAVDQLFPTCRTRDKY